MKSDVAVIGGGPAGAVAAYVLSRLGVNVVVLDTPGPRRSEIIETLSPAAGQLLKRLSLEAALEGQKPYAGLDVVWGSEARQARDLIFEPYGGGWQLNREQFDASLKYLSIDSGAKWLSHAHFLGAVRTNRRWHASYRRADGSMSSIEVRICIDATGRRARFARSVGARQLQSDRLIAIARLLRQSRRRNEGKHDILIESSENGWWYSAPSNPGMLWAVYFTDYDLPSTRKFLLERDEPLALAPCTAARGDGQNSGFRSVRSSRTSRLFPYATTTWVAAGDAAIAFDPLTSHGIANAISSGFYAAHTANDLLHEIPDAVKSYTYLLNRTFDQCRQVRNAIYMVERRWSHVDFWSRRSPNLYFDISEESGHKHKLEFE